MQGTFSPRWEIDFPIKLRCVEPGCYENFENFDKYRILNKLCILTRENCRPVRKFIFLYNYVVLSRDTGRARIIERLIFGSFARQRASHASHSSLASFARPFHIVEGRRHEVVDMHGRGRQRRPAGGVRPCMSTTFDRASGAGYVSCTSRYTSQRSLGTRICKPTSHLHVARGSLQTTFENLAT